MLEMMVLVSPHVGENHIEEIHCLVMDVTM